QLIAEAMSSRAPAGERPTAWISSPRSTSIPRTPRTTPVRRLPVTGSRRTHTPSSTPHTGNVYARIAARPDSMNVTPYTARTFQAATLKSVIAISLGQAAGGKRIGKPLALAIGERPG